MLGTGRLELYLSYDRPVPAGELERYRSLVRRRLDGEPVAYIVGRVGFRDLDLRVDRRVLVPRPETELLVGHVLEWAHAEAARGARPAEGWRMLDLGPRILRVETAAFSLHVLRGDGVAATEPVRPDTVSDTDLRSSRMVEPKNSAVSDTGVDLVTVAAPMLGTFYRAEAPGAAPYVEVGARVEPDSVVCLIEVMKMMNAVTAGVSGTVVEVCAENAQLVEHGDPLFRIEAES